MDIPPDIEVNFAHPGLSGDFSEVINEYFPTQTTSKCSEHTTLQFQSTLHDIEDDDDFDDTNDFNDSVSVTDIHSPILQSRMRDFVGGCRTRYSDLSSDSDECCEADDIGPNGTGEFEHEADVTSLQLQKSKGCKKGCLNKLSDKSVIEHRLNMQEMQKSEKDLLIIGQLQASGVSKGDVTRKGERKRHKFNYQFDNVDICADCFLYVNNISSKYMKNLRKHMYSHGSTPRVHGNTGRRPHNAIAFEDVQHIVQFIIGYADRNGMPQPCAPGNSTSIPPVYPPAKDTYCSLHKTYLHVASEMGYREITEPTFRGIRKECVPHIQFLTMRTDVCHTCEKFRKDIQEARTETEKLVLADGLAAHIRDAQTERGFYKDRCTAAQQEIADYVAGQELSYVHYTFDFAQSVLVPSHVRQEGVLYYKSPLKISWFGIINDGRPVQYNYIFSEVQAMGLDNESSHSANAVISMIHDFLFKYSEKEKSCYLNCDNCGGQNKNQVVTSYLCWRTMQGLHDSMYLHFMKPYHARCQIDGMFGLGRQKLRKNDLDSLFDVSKVISASSKYSKCVQYEDEGSDAPNWVWQYFRAVSLLQQYFHFRFSKDRPGYVMVKKSVDSEEKEIRLLKRGKCVPVDALPCIVNAAGLSPARQWYLYKNVRAYVASKKQDVTAPRPAVSEPERT